MNVHKSILTIFLIIIAFTIEGLMYEPMIPLISQTINSANRYGFQADIPILELLGIVIFVMPILSKMRLFEK